MNAKSIAVLGAGGTARELVAILRESPDRFSFAGFVTSNPGSGKYDSREETIGSVKDLVSGVLHVEAVCCGIGSPNARRALFNEIATQAPHLEWPPIVSKHAILMDPARIRIDAAAVVSPGVILTTNIKIGSNTLLNFGSTVGHETTIGPNCVVNPGANLSGGITLGESVLVGTGAQVLQYLSIGERATIGASSCVTKDVAPGATVVGIPAKPRS